jgi:hypothetical protein
MHPEREQDKRLEADGVLARPLGGQIYLVEEGDGIVPRDEESPPDRSPLSGLIHRH